MPITFLRHAHLRPTRCRRSRDVLGDRITLAMSILMSSATGNDASPVFGRIRPPRRECNRPPGFGWAISLCYRQSPRSDLLDGRMAELLTVHDPRGYPSVDAPFQARENVGVVVARGRMLSSVRPGCGRKTAAGLYGVRGTGSRSPTQMSNGQDARLTLLVLVTRTNCLPRNRNPSYFSGLPYRCGFLR